MAELEADCSRCFALCCVGLTFIRSTDFPVDKRAGRPCLNLTDAHRCSVHSSLREQGWIGCVSYDCFGAGQRVSQETFGGRDWRTHPEIAPQMFAALPVMRQLHELLAYLADAGGRAATAPWHEVMVELSAEVDAIAAGDLAGVDLDAVRGRIAPVLREASRLVRAGLPGADHTGADLIGAKLAGADLRGADLRGAYLIAADLRDARLQSADLLGADLRDAELAGADLTGALYLSQAQLNSARGDAGVRIDGRYARPAHWD